MIRAQVRPDAQDVPPGESRGPGRGSTSPNWRGAPPCEEPGRGISISRGSILGVDMQALVTTVVAASLAGGQRTLRRQVRLVD